jgi:hypothetical protein
LERDSACVAAPAADRIQPGAEDYRRDRQGTAPCDIRAAFEREYVATTLPICYSGRAQHNVADGTVEPKAHLIDGTETV